MKWDELNCDVDSKNGGTKDPSCNLHTHVQWSYSKKGGTNSCGATKEKHSQLHSHFNTGDEPEEWIVEQGLENVFLVWINNSTVDLIEQIHQDVRMEVQSIKYDTWRWISLIVSQVASDEIRHVLSTEEHQSSKVHEDDHHNDLVERHENDLSPHGCKNELLCSADSIRCKFWILIGWLSSKSNGTENIHYQIAPKHLNNVEWWMTEGETTQNSDEAERNVHCHLELKEFLHVVKNSSAPFNCFMN